MQELGVTKPITEVGPTELDLKLTASLEATLRVHNMYETEAEARQREIVLGKLNSLVRLFVKRVCLLQNHPEAFANEAGGKIFTFGSYRLGVHGSGADIDTLCVAPRNVTRSHFFTVFHDMLSEHPEVTELQAVTDAYVPVIKMHFAGIPIDLLFASLDLHTIPDHLDVLQNSLLRSLDGATIRSLNGSRVADQIVRLVPNIPTFHTALRCIKLWAKQRAVYSNVMGYLGGVAWALLVARICQLYPNAVASSIVMRFFRIYYKWNWPNPVMLKHIEEGPLTVWNPKIYQHDRLHIMPIITPAYPSMCATHNVSRSTLRTMTDEFLRGSMITVGIEQGKHSWEDLFEKSDFFYRFKNYLLVAVVAQSVETHRKWVGFVESKLRQLVKDLECLSALDRAPPYPYGFEAVVQAKSLDEALQLRQMGRVISAKVTGSGDTPSLDAVTGDDVKQMEKDQDQGKLTTNVEREPTDDTETMKVDETKEIEKSNENEKSELPSYYMTTFFIGLSFSETRLLPVSVPNAAAAPLDLSYIARNFRELVTRWPARAADMDCAIRHLKRSALPDYVYEGAPRPTHFKKKRGLEQEGDVAKRPAQELQQAQENGNATPVVAAAAAVPMPVQRPLADYFETNPDETDELPMNQQVTRPSHPTSSTLQPIQVRLANAKR